MDTEPHRTGTERIVRSREELPTDPPAGDYVVIDVTHFSATVIELLANDAQYVHVTRERGDEFAFQESVPDALIGGGKTDDYEPEPGYDFFNSPSYVAELPVADRPTAMTSKNGGTAVRTLAERGDDVTIFVGGFTNARAIGTFLRERSRPTYLVAAGSGGIPTTDDLLGAVLIDRYLSERPPTAAETAQFELLLTVAKGPRYREKHERRQIDLDEFASDIDSRSVVPVLDGEQLVRATTR